MKEFSAEEIRIEAVSTRYLSGLGSDDIGWNRSSDPSIVLTPLFIRAWFGLHKASDDKLIALF